MKPSKKNLCKKEIKTKESSIKLQTFFKPAPKTFVIKETHHIDADPTKEIYVEALKQKLKDYYAENACASQDKNSLDQEDSVATVVEERHDLCPQTQTKTNDAISSCEGCEQRSIEVRKWQNEAQEWQNKYKDLKKSHIKMSLAFSDLQMKHNDLVQIATNQVHSESESEVGDVLSEDGVFTPNEIKSLLSIPREKAKDSTFVLKCIEYAYKDNPSVLLTKSLKGVPESTEIKDDGTKVHIPAKQPLTPKKVEAVRKLFLQRLTKCKIGAVEHAERLKESSVNKLFASGIKNVAKKHK